LTYSHNKLFLSSFVLFVSHVLFRFVRDNVDFRGGTPAFWEKIFDNLDQDKDGKVSMKEYLIALSMHMKAPLDDRLTWVFGIFDSDGSGCLDRKEVHNLLVTLFNEIHLEEGIG
jgi:Ca2+-binding EF-hand superfamily protein